MIDTKEIILERLKYGLRYINVSGLDVERIGEYLAYQVRGYVWAQDAGKKEVVKYPADWWQAFKERWFPAWLLARYPVVYRVHEFQVKATYPDLVIERHEPVLRLIKAKFTDDRPAV